MTESLLAGDFTPLRANGKRRERKVQVFPDQSRRCSASRLAALPHLRIRLSRDVPASISALRKAAKAI